MFQSFYLKFCLSFRISEKRERERDNNQELDIITESFTNFALGILLYKLDLTVKLLLGASSG